MRGSLLLALGGFGLFACAEASSSGDDTGAVGDPGTPNPSGGIEVFEQPPMGEPSDPVEMSNPEPGSEPPEDDAIADDEDVDFEVPPAGDSPVALVPPESDSIEPAAGDDLGGTGGTEQQGTQTGDQGSGGSPSQSGGAGGSASCDPFPELPIPEETLWTGTLSAPGALTSDGDAASLALAYTDPGQRECMISVDATLTFTSDGLSFTTNVWLWLEAEGASGTFFVSGSAVTPQSALPSLDAFEPFDVMGDDDGQAGIVGFGGEGGGPFSGPGGSGGLFGIGGLGGASANPSSGPGGAGPERGGRGSVPPTGGSNLGGSASGGFVANVGGVPSTGQVGGEPQGGAPPELAECSLPTFTTIDANPFGVSLRGDLTIDATTDTSALELVWMRRDQDGSTWYSIGQGCAEFELATQ